MRSKLLLQLLARRSPRQEQGVIALAAGVVAAIVIILGAAAVVQLTGSNLRGVFASSDTRAARAAATEGADLMIDTWNQPQNRRLLVSGADPSGWNAGDANLRSPCVDTRTNNDVGPPNQAAIDLADGAWRNVVTGAVAAANQDGRQYRLLSITYTASDVSANPNPRQLRRRFAVNPEGGAGPVQSPGGGEAWDTLVNLDDPDGDIGALQPGRNSGFLVLEVEGRVVRGGQVVANSRETREFEVLPKCCGASLGSQGSGGVTYPANTTGSLGSDSRLCNIQYGIATGFNGGWHWSFYANDQFTQEVDGQIVRYNSILGVVQNAGDAFNRAECRVRPGRGKQAPGNCPDPTAPADDGFNQNAISVANAIDADEEICRQRGSRNPDRNYFSGPQTDIDGTTASCSQIIPFIANNFPPISDFEFTWTIGRGPDTLIQAAEPEDTQSDNVQLWPRISTDNNDGTGPNSETTIRLRTNNTNDEDEDERVEICVVDLDDDTAVDDCTADTWLNVTSRGIRDTRFYAAGSSATGSQEAFLDTGGNQTGPTPLNLNGAGSNRPSAFWDVNLNILQTPYLEFTISRSSSFDNGDTLIIEASPDDGGNWYRLTRTPLTGAEISTGGTTFRVGLPFSGDDVRIQFRAGNNWSGPNLFNPGGENIAIQDFKIESSVPGVIANSRSAAPIFGSPWCEFADGNAPIVGGDAFMCIGPSFDQWDGGTIFIDTSGGPLSFYYTEPETTDLRFGPNDTSNSTARRNNFVYISRSAGGVSARLAHVNCDDILPECAQAFDATDNPPPVGTPDQLNFFGRETGGFGSTGNEQNILITTEFGTPARVAGIWFYMPQARVELNIDPGPTGSATSVPTGFYTNNQNNWSFSGRIWVKQFKPFGAFHLRVPNSSLPNRSLGQASAANFVPWQGFDWVARAVTNTRLW